MSQTRRYNPFEKIAAESLANKYMKKCCGNYNWSFRWTNLRITPFRIFWKDQNFAIIHLSTHFFTNPLITWFTKRQICMHLGIAVKMRSVYQEETVKREITLLRGSFLEPILPGPFVSGTYIALCPRCRAEHHFFGPCRFRRYCSCCGFQMLAFENLHPHKFMNCNL